MGISGAMFAILSAGCLEIDRGPPRNISLKQDTGSYLSPLRTEQRYRPSRAQTLSPRSSPWGLLVSIFLGGKEESPTTDSINGTFTLGRRSVKADSPSQKTAKIRPIFAQSLLGI